MTTATLSRDQREILAFYADGSSPREIGRLTGIDLAFVGGTIANVAKGSRDTARQLVGPSTRPATPPTEPVEAKPEPAIGSVDTLLDRADHIDLPRVRRAAARIRANAATLANLLDAAEQEAKLHTELAQHLAEINRLRAELRQLTGKNGETA
jgi:hypothetical protein